MQDLIIFSHIPKTAGTVIRKSIRTSFKHEQIIEDARGEAVRAIKEKVKQFDGKRKNEVKVIAGHFAYGWHDFFPDRTPQYFTVLRDPVQRVISHYRHVLRDEKHYLHEEVVRNGMSLSQYVSSGVCDEVNNGQTSLLAGKEIKQRPYGVPKEEYGKNDAVVLENALSNLKQYTAVGIQESYLKTIALFNTVLPEIDVDPISINTAPSGGLKVSSEDVRQIKAFNKLDLVLYEKGQQLFEQQYRKAGVLCSMQFLWLKNKNLLRKVKRKVLSNVKKD